MIKGAVLPDDDNDVLDGSCRRWGRCLGVGGLGQSREHLQRNQHHRAALQGPVRGVDRTFQGDTSRNTEGLAYAVGEFILSAINLEAVTPSMCNATMK